MARTLLLTVLVLAINLIYFAIQQNARKRAQFAKSFALWMMVGFGLLGGLFTAGYALADPGGSTGSLLIALWAVPLIVLSVMAWLKSKFVKPVLWVLLIAAGITNLVSLFFSDEYREFIDQRGPWLAVGSFAFTIVATVFGYHLDARLGGLMNIAIALMPIAMSILAFDFKYVISVSSTAAALTPGFTAGILLLISSYYLRLSGAIGK